MRPERTHAAVRHARIAAHGASRTAFETDSFLNSWRAHRTLTAASRIFVWVHILDDTGRGPLETAVVETLAEATGRERRVDPVLPGTGGPAGNAALTAWTAMVLLVVSFAEGLTLVNVRGLISWHVALGALLVPPALLKTASTGWRMVRYYVGSPSYRMAGPPPILLRLLGPLVVVSTLGLLGSGVVLVLLGPDGSYRSAVSMFGLRLDWVGVHKGFFLVWFAIMTLHVLGRILPALRIAVTSVGGSTPVPGEWTRWLLLVATLASAAALAVALVHVDGSWVRFQPFFLGGDG